MGKIVQLIPRSVTNDSESKSKEILDVVNWMNEMSTLLKRIEISLENTAHHATENINR